MDIALIAAVAENDVIGDAGELPWQGEEWTQQDMQHFRETTTGHPVIMGRATYESLPDAYQPLPERYNIVLSTTLEAVDDVVAPSIDAALDEAEEYLDGRSEDTAYVIGGADVYEQFLPHANQLILTEISKPYEGDTYFPSVDWTQWEETHRDSFAMFDIATYHHTTDSDPL